MIYYHYCEVRTVNKCGIPYDKETYLKLWDENVQFYFRLWKIIT